MIETIKCDDTVIAIIIYRQHRTEGINFVTAPDFSLQLGHMRRPAGYTIVPHIHNPVKRETVGTQEVLFIKEGEIEVDFYSFNQEYLESRTLSQGDIILLVGAGHGITVLKEAVIVEVKNGPYMSDADKGRFEGDKHTSAGHKK